MAMKSAGYTLGSILRGNAAYTLHTGNLKPCKLCLMAAKTKEIPVEAFQQENLPQEDKKATSVPPKKEPVESIKKQ